MSEPCHFKDCEDLNYNTALYIVDCVGSRYFCLEHWKVISYFFARVRRCEDCWRDLDSERENKATYLTAMKFNDKWYNLCFDHYGLAENKLLEFILLE